MTLPVIDRDSSSTVAAAEGQAALAAGDTLRAREKNDEAGELLERKIARARKQADKHFFRFLAASQYYQGGNYPKALELCQRIEQRLLPPEIRELYPKFLQDVKSRTSADYAQQVRRQFASLLARKEYATILELFQQHPYVFQPQRMAFGRAFACEELKQYQAAAAFYADVVRWTPEEPGVFFTATAVPLSLSREGRLEEAWEYIQYQLNAIPHAVTYMNASLLCYYRASVVKGEERRRLYEEQLRYFDKAWQAFEGLPPEQSKHPDILSLMVWALQTAAFALLRLGDRSQAKQICDQAIKFDPNSPNSWEVRGIVTYPSEEAVADFQRATSLGAKSYFSCYSLAHNALTKKDFRAALSLCEQALNSEGKPGRPFEAQLYGWSAICHDALGTDWEEVERLFKKARDLDPQSEEVEYNFRLFRETEGRETPGHALAWAVGHAQCSDDQFVFDREALLRAASKSRDQIQILPEAA